MKLLILLLFTSLSLYGQDSLAVRITQQEEEIYCKVSKVTLEITNKKVTLVTEKGSLDLTVLKRKVGEENGYIAVNDRGVRYFIYAVDFEGGHVIHFIPENDYYFKYLVSNRRLCDE